LSAQDFIQNLIFGLALGSMYALVALGYTMVYGVLKFINFAHGDVVMVGAFMGYLANLVATRLMGMETTSVPTALIAFTFSLAFCGLLGFTIERLAYRPLRKSPRLTALITAIGISLLLENIAQLNFNSVAGPTFLSWWPFSPIPRAFPEFIKQRALIDIGGVQISNLDVMTILLSAGLMGLLYFIVFKTKLGRALRAVSHNPDVASLMGIPVDRVISATFVLGSVLAGAAGMQYGLKYSKIDPLIGVMLGLKAFVAAVLGGIGNIPGAMLGGLLMGVLEQLVVGLGGSTYRDALAFVILIAVLLFRPSGLLGKFEPEKV
jgi:branched-chain amino acid transport system permease protein